MKKLTVIALAILMFVALSSCNSTVPASPKNTITTAELSAEQQEIIDLFALPNSQELMLFDFNADEAYRSVEVWVEVYQDGELIERPAGVSTHRDTGEELNGRMAVIAQKTDTGFQWTVSVVENASKASHVGISEIVIATGFARAYGPMNGSVNIEDGKEIVLYSSVFSDANAFAAYDSQTIQERSELFSEYPYAQLIKCRFAS